MSFNHSFNQKIPVLYLLQIIFIKLIFKKMKFKPDHSIPNSMSKDPGNWRGVFYFNKKDPRLVVPKLYPSMGWTFNFASPYPYLAIICIIAIVVISKYLL